MKKQDSYNKIFMLLLKDGKVVVKCLESNVAKLRAGVNRAKKQYSAIAQESNSGTVSVAWSNGEATISLVTQKDNPLEAEFVLVCEPMKNTGSN